MDQLLGYCTNVHAGASLAQTREQLQAHAVGVRERFCPNRPMGIGLWFSAETARELEHPERLRDFKQWLESQQLIPYTLNGFPYGDFHQKVVKHQVYLPTWTDLRRLEYTRRLARILDQLLPDQAAGTISTLPLAWGDPAYDRQRFAEASRQLQQLAAELEELRQRTGRHLVVCLEPEPGCVIDTADDMIRFFHDYLWIGDHAEAARSHLGVCHDVCHAMVMNESQAGVLEQYRQAGVQVAKVQVSSAIQVDFARLSAPQRVAALQQLNGFAEDRYLHQTMVSQPDGSRRLYEDLPDVIRLAGPPEQLHETWRIHFHVPIYLPSFGNLETGRAEIEACLDWFQSRGQQAQWEVETYAWGVLPPDLQRPQLAEGIADELRWLSEKL